MRTSSPKKSIVREKRDRRERDKWKKRLRCMLCFPRLNPSASSSRLHLLRMGKRVEYECRQNILRMCPWNCLGSVGKTTDRTRRSNRTRRSCAFHTSFVSSSEDRSINSVFASLDRGIHLLQSFVCSRCYKFYDWIRNWNVFFRADRGSWCFFYS